MNTDLNSESASGSSGRSKSAAMIWLIPLVSIAAGTAIGAGSAMLGYQEPVLRLAGHEVTANAKAPTIKDAKPRVHVVGEKTFDFGVMARNERNSHTFQVQNIGTGPLTLKVLDTTCKCTVGSLGKDSIKAGETADVTLTWEAKSYDREFRQSATIETNDQSEREIVFSVSGQVLQLAMPDVPVMNFSRVSRSDPQTFKTVVYGYRDADLVITDHKFTNEDDAEFFSIATKPLPKEGWLDKQAKSAIEVTVDIKPGLPVGVVHQLIKLQTNKDDIAPIDVVVHMTVVSDISVLGTKKFNDETNTLMLGPVSKAEGKEVKLYVAAKGKYKEQIDFKLESADPEGILTAEVGEPNEIKTRNADGEQVLASLLFPVTIIVNKDSKSVQRMGSTQGALGRVTFSTNHPEIEKFDIRVQFAVQ